MTSFSDAGLWKPLDLPSATPGVAFGPPGFAPVVEIATADTADADWLPRLQSTAELRVDRDRRAREEQAYERGCDDASQLERVRADALCATALEAVSRAVNHLDAIAGEFGRDRERDLQGLAIAIARNIVQHELTIDPLRVGELVRRALDLLPLDHTLELRLSPEDLRTLAPSLEGLSPEGRQVKIQWVGDPSIDRGGFIIETPHRIVDGRTDIALRALYDRFDHE